MNIRLLGDGYQQWHTNISMAQTPQKHLDEVLCWGLKFMASRQFSLFCYCSVKQVKTQWNLMTWKQRSTGRLQFTGVLFRGPCHERLEATQGPRGAKQPQLPCWESLDKPLAGRSSREPEHLGLDGLVSIQSRQAPLAVNQWPFGGPESSWTVSWAEKRRRKRTPIRFIAEQGACFHSWVGCFKRPAVTSAAPSLNKSEIRGRRSQAWSAVSPWLPPPIPVLLRLYVLLDLRHTVVEVPGTLITS